MTMDELVDIPLAPAVLDYATYDADGVPPYVPEAEELIESRANPKKIRKYFSDADQAVKYIAKSMRRRFPLVAAGTNCSGCHAECDTVAMTEWIVLMRDKWTSFRLRRQRPHAKFVTYHCLCVSCCSRWGASLKRMQIASAIFVRHRWAWIIAIVIASNLIGHKSILSTWLFPIFWMFYMLMLVISSLALARWSRLRVPRGIANVLPPKIHLVAIQAFDYRGKLSLVGSGNVRQA